MWNIGSKSYEHSQKKSVTTIFKINLKIRELTIANVWVGLGNIYYKTNLSHTVKKVRKNT